MRPSRRPSALPLSRVRDYGTRDNTIGIFRALLVGRQQLPSVCRLCTSSWLRRRRAKQDQAVHAVRVPITGAADAGTLYAVTIRSRTLAAAAVSKGSASLMTELMTARLALIEALDGYRQSSR